MKITIQSITIVVMILSSFILVAYRNGDVVDYSFKSVDEEVAMNIERGKGEVLLHLMVRDMKQYDHIVIERSSESENNFGKCKYISCSSPKADNSILLEVDKYPYTANKNVYYRIKTITKDGIERIYPAVLLSAAAK